MLKEKKLKKEKETRKSAKKSSVVKYCFRFRKQESQSRERAIEEEKETLQVSKKKRKDPLSYDFLSFVLPLFKWKTR